MLSNILSLTFRRLFKKGSHFLVSLLSLSVGIASVILMFYYIKYEYSYDKFNDNYDQLYRVERTSITGSQNHLWDSAPYKLAGELQNTIPEIKNTACMAMTANYFTINNQLFHEKYGLFADNSALELFAFQMIQGDKKSALQAPMSIVLSKSLAEKLFSNKNAVGKDIEVDKKFIFKVTGVFADYPENSHLRADYLISFASYDEMRGTNRDASWESNNSSIYVLLNQNTNGQSVSQKVKNLLNNHLNLREGEKELLSLRPMGDIYLNSKQVRNDKMLGRRNDIGVVFIFLGVALFTIIITIINYVNSITAQLLDREKEIGIKKVLCVSKSNLRLQFITESCLSVTMAFILALVIVNISVPIFNTVVDRNLTIPFFAEWRFFSGAFLASLLLAVLVGLYPVFFLSSLKISAFLQGMSSLRRRRTMRKVLLVLQLTVAIPLVFSSFLFIEQIKFLENKDLGFQKDNLLVAGLTSADPQDKERVKLLQKTLLTDPSILSVAVSNSAPFAGGYEENISWDENDPDKQIKLRAHDVDYDFLNTYKMTLLEGRNFSKEKSTDVEKACILNETALQQFGWDVGAGKKIKIGNEQYEVIGTVKDFHDYTLFYEIPPMLFTLYDYQSDRMYLSIKVSEGVNAATVQRKINKEFNEKFPNIPIEFQYFASKFQDDQFFVVLRGMSKIFIFFAFLAIFLSIIGLYNLVSFSLKTQRRMIAIRKVMGAENFNLFTFLTKEYLILFVIALGISLTSTYLINSVTFQMFVYKVDSNPFMMVIAVMIVLFFLLLTISGKIYQASRQNPIVDLKADN